MGRGSGVTPSEGGKKSSIEGRASFKGLVVVPRDVRSEVRTYAACVSLSARGGACSGAK